MEGGGCVCSHYTLLIPNIHSLDLWSRRLDATQELTRAGCVSLKAPESSAPSRLIFFFFVKSSSSVILLPQHKTQEH